MYEWIPSLEHMAAVRVALALYYDKDIEKILEQKLELFFPKYYSDSQQREMFKRIEEQAKKKIAFLPDLLKIRVSKLIRTLHLQVERWIQDHHDLLQLTEPACYLAIKRRLSWSSDGTIDRVRVIKTLLQDRKTDRCRRFRLASTYFLEDEIFSIWNERSSPDEIPPKPFIRNICCRHNLAVLFWWDRLAYESWRHFSLEDMIEKHFDFPRLYQSRWKLRFSCFFPFLSWTLKKLSFVILKYPNKVHHDDYIECMRSLSNAERDRIYTAYPVPTLSRYLEWPRQSLAVDVEEKLKRRMGEKEFDAALLDIMSNNIGQ